MTDPRKKLEKLRKEKGWSLSQFAKKIGVSETAVYNWYNEKNSMPTVFVLSDACDVLKTTMSELFSEAETDKLTAAQLECLELFTKVPERKKRAALDILRALAD